MTNLRIYLLPLARLLMSSLFIWEGVVQLRDPADTAEFFASVGVPLPGVSIWISMAIHVLGGLAILVGFKARWAAAVLAALCLGTALGVHLPAGSQDDTIHFYKNLVMAGGFFYVMSFGAGGWSFDKDSPVA